MSQEFILKTTKKTHIPAKISTEKFSKRVVRIERACFVFKKTVHFIVCINFIPEKEHSK